MVVFYVEDLYGYISKVAVTSNLMWIEASSLAMALIETISISNFPASLIPGCNDIIPQHSYAVLPHAGPRSRKYEGLSPV